MVPQELLSALDSVPSRKMAPDWAMTLTASLAIIISIVGFLGNILTILALPHFKKLRNAATWFVVNLAVIEMCFCIAILPMSAAHLIHLKTTGEKLFTQKGCKWFVFLRYLLIQAELLSIAIIALNRCILIATPQKYPSIFNSTRTFCFIIGIWTCSVVIMIFPLTEIFGAFSYNVNTQECDFDTQSTSARKVFTLVGFFIPFLIIVVSYSYIFYMSKRSSRRIRQQTCQPSSGGVSSVRPVAAGLRNREMRVAKTIAVIFLAFLVCCTPVSVVHYYGSQGQAPLLLLLLHPLYWLQYCINGFIYVFMNKQYREAYVNYISSYWPNFKTVIQNCYTPTDDESSVDSQPGSRAMRVFRKLSMTRKARVDSTQQSPRIIRTPTYRKKFQCWDPSQQEDRLNHESNSPTVSKVTSGSSRSGSLKKELPHNSSLKVKFSNDTKKINR